MISSLTARTISALIERLNSICYDIDTGEILSTDEDFAEEVYIETAVVMENRHDGPVMLGTIEFMGGGYEFVPKETVIKVETPADMT